MGNAGARHLATLFAALLISLPAHASEWWYVTASTDNNVFFTDTQSIQRQGVTAVFWEYEIYKTPIAKTVSVKIQYSLDCSSKRMSGLASVTYDAAGTAISSDGPIASFSIAPDTVGDAVQKFVCASGPDRQRLGTKLALSPEESAKRIFAITNAPQ